MSGIELVSGMQGDILHSLATYRFLTVRLMVLLGISRHEKSVREALQPLINRRWVGRTARTSIPQRGGIDMLHWLNPSGAAAVAELFGVPEPVPVRHAPQLVEALKHRIAILRTHILLRQWAASAGATVTAFRAEYDAGPSRGQKATAIPYQESNQARAYTPDAIATVQLADGRPRLLVIEVYQGGRGRRLDHFKAKLAELRMVAEQEAVEAHEGHDHTGRFLVVFADDAMREAALRWWPDPAAEVWEAFFVKSVAELDGDFAGRWWGPGRNPAPLFAVGASMLA